MIGGENSRKTVFGFWLLEERGREVFCKGLSLYVPTRVQSKQAEIPMQRLPTEGEVHPNDMAVFPVGKAARATVNIVD